MNMCHMLNNVKNSDFQKSLISEQVITVFWEEKN